MLMADCEALLRRAQRAAGTAVLTWQGATADANQPFERLSVADAFKRHCGIDLLATAPDPAGCGTPGGGPARRGGGERRYRAASGRRLGSAVLSDFSRSHRAASRHQ